MKSIPHTAEREADDLRCPDCEGLASRTLAFGWLFKCDLCETKWGHPQHIDRAIASEMLFDAKEGATL
jgi:ribosomal protein L37AE/L43A